MREIYPTAEFYGHAHILKKYAGLAQLMPLPFGVQHGYTFGVGDYDTKGIGDCHNADTLWVWSEQDRIDFQSVLPKTRVEALGAPFLYLLKHLDINIPDEPQRRGAIVFPPHSSEAVKIDGKHVEICAFLNDLEEDFYPIDICMYYKDIQYGMDRPYLEKGFKVYSLSNSRLDQKFIYKFILSVLDKKHAFIGDFSTAALYCAYLGLSVSQIQVIPEVIVNKNLWHKNRGPADEMYREEKMQNILNSFFGRSASEQKMFAAKSLGADFLLRGNEVRNLIAVKRKSMEYKNLCLDLAFCNFKSIIKKATS
jgi:hypothetical protein